MANLVSMSFSKFISWLFVNPDESFVEREAPDKDAIIVAVDEAKQNWLTAKAFFNCITDPDLIDYAVYALEAAERKYMYLLKQLKTNSQQSDQEIPTEKISG